MPKGVGGGSCHIRPLIADGIYMSNSSAYDSRFVSVLRSHCRDLEEVVVLYPREVTHTQEGMCESSEILARFSSPIGRHSIQQRFLVEVVSSHDGTVTSQVTKIGSAFSSSRDE